MTKQAFKKCISILIVLFLILFAFTGCITNEEPKKDKDGSDNGDGNGNGGEKSEFELKIEKINQKAVAWLESLAVDPVKLKYDLGLKGKKKFVELLDSYLILYQTTTDPQEKLDYLTIVENLTNVTYEIQYHDLNVINDTLFRQDSTSYLRAWYIMTQFGLNTSYYEDEIAKVMPRMTAHLPTRGINQKMVFVFYYEQLGYPIDYTLEQLFNYSVVRDRNLKENLSDLDLYFITHEIFVLHDDDKMSILTDNDIDYVKEIIQYHVNRTISVNNVDLLSELVMIMTYLGFENMTLYKSALEYILTNQNANGSFGYYEQYREPYAELGISVDIQLYLHTTEVTLRALNEAVDVFEENV